MNILVANNRILVHHYESNRLIHNHQADQKEPGKKTAKRPPMEQRVALKLPPSKGPEFQLDQMLEQFIPLG